MSLKKESIGNSTTNPKKTNLWAIWLREGSERPSNSRECICREVSAIMERHSSLSTEQSGPNGRYPLVKEAKDQKEGQKRPFPVKAKSPVMIAVPKEANPAPNPNRLTSVTLLL